MYYQLSKNLHSQVEENTNDSFYVVSQNLKLAGGNQFAILIQGQLTAVEVKHEKHEKIESFYM